MVVSPLLAVAFMNPVLLWGLGLVGVPVIIHLLSRRYHRRIEWGATRFLLEAEQQTRRRTRFEQWLLLALRCLAMGLLALLVARPYVRPGLVAALLGARGQVARIVVLDDSASLSYRTGANVEFDQLRAAAVRLLSWLHQEAPRDPVTVYLTSDAAQPLVADAVLSETDLADLRERLSEREPVSTRARPGRVLAQIAEHLSSAATAAADVYVLSDFQRSDWLRRSHAGQSVFEPLRRLSAGSAAAGRQVRVILVASGLHRRDNVALVDVELDRPQTVAGLPAVVRARAVNHSARPLDDLVIQVAIDGVPLPAVPVGPLEAGQQKDVSLEVTFPDDGYHELALTIDPVDSFRPDDTRRRAVRVKAALAVLAVNGAPAVDPRDDEVFLLRNALAPPGPLSSGVRVHVVDPEEIAATELSAYDAVLLCNVAPLPAIANGMLQQYVRRGGGLAFFLGSEVGDPGEYNRAFWAEGSGLLPLPLERLLPAGQEGGVGLVRTGEHAVTAMFPAGTDALSESVRFRQYYRCAEVYATLPKTRPGSEEDEKVITPLILARYADAAGTPALVERRFGRGRVVLFTSSIDLDWNDWARTVDGSYVVTMLELVQYLARRDTHPPHFVAGEPLTLPVSPEEYELSALLKFPAQADEPALEIVARGTPPAPGEPATLEGPVATRLGTYVVELATRSGRSESRPLCVNLDAAESDLAAAASAELDAALAGLPHELVTAAEDFLRGTEQTRHELWPAVLIVLLATLLLEQALAWWFGVPRDRAVRSRRRVVQPGV